MTAQRYGDHDVAMRHVDMAYPDFDLGWSRGLVDAGADYASPAICHYACEAAPPDPRDLAVPWNDVILVFGAGMNNELPRAGWSVWASFDAAKLPPTFISVSSDGSGGVTPRVVKSALDGDSASFAVELPEGKLLLSLDKSGGLGVVGDAGAVAVLVQAGGVTVFGDGVMLRGYPGAPTSVVAVGEGACSEPFHVARSAQDAVTVSPETACTETLWLAPLASLGHGVGIDEKGFVIPGTQLRPSILAPVRDGIILERGKAGPYRRSLAPSGVAVDVAAKLSTALYETVPLFSAPLASPPLSVPADVAVYVFHQKVTDEPNDAYPPPYPPTDVAWTGDDTPDSIFVPPCDPTLPSPPVWGNGIDGSGAKPAYATAIQDLHGARWTYYADAAGRLIRTVNHETGASRWMEYDPAGRITGVLAPDGARQCLRYDNAGNLMEVLSLPAWQPDLPTPEPIRERFGWTVAPARLSYVLDPRDPARVLRRYEYDAAGNLEAVIEVDGTRTTITPVSGGGPARAMPASVVGPDGAVTRIAYDVATGTVRTVTQDAAGPSPVLSEVQSDAAGRPVWSTSPLGLIETLEWSGPVLVARSWDADGLVRSEAYEYDGDAKLERLTRGREQVSFQYDATGGLTSTAQVALDASVSTAVHCQRSAPGGRSLEVVSAEGSRIRYTYDGEGRVLSVVAGDLGPSADAWDDACPEHATGASASGTLVSYEYDTSGRRVAMVDGRGFRTTWRYDGFGRSIIERRPDSSEIRTGYDSVGQVAWQAAYSGNANPVYRAPQWGEAGLMAAVELRYDLRGRLEEARRWHFDAQGVPVGDGYARTTYRYDEVGRTVTMTDDLDRSTRLRMDGAGRGVEVTLPDGSLVTTAYLDGGRTVRTTRNGVGGAVAETSTLTATGAVTEQAVVVAGAQRVVGTTTWLDPFVPGATTSATGIVTTPTYDAFERLSGVRTTIPGGRGEASKLLRDRDGRVTTRISDAGAGGPEGIWRFSYDALGRQVRETDPAGASTVTSYLGPTGFVLTSTDPRLVRTYPLHEPRLPRRAA